MTPEQALLVGVTLGLGIGTAMMFAATLVDSWRRGWKMTEDHQSVLAQPPHHTDLFALGRAAEQVLSQIAPEPPLPRKENPMPDETPSLQSSNPGVQHVLQFFAYAHLPPHLQEVSKDFAVLAQKIADSSSNAETTAALRKLVEAKDCAVRAKLVKA